MSERPVLAVTSPNNSRVKLAASLLRRKEREAHGLVLVEGERLIGQALDFGAHFRYFFVEPARIQPDLWARIQSTGADIMTVDGSILHKVSGTPSPQGVVGVAEAVDEHQAIASEAAFVVVIDALQDPGNLGAIQRIATAVDVDLMLLTKGTVDPKHPRAIRASAGAYFRSCLSTDWEPALLADHLREQGFRIVVADAKAEHDHFSFNWGGRIALVIGNEGSGPDERLRGTHFVRIPMPGGGESLNASVAAGVLLYEAWNARRPRH